MPYNWNHTVFHGKNLLHIRQPYNLTKHLITTKFGASLSCEEKYPVILILLIFAIRLPIVLNRKIYYKIIFYKQNFSNTIF